MALNCSQGTNYHHLMVDIELFSIEKSILTRFEKTTTLYTMFVIVF